MKTADISACFIAGTIVYSIWFRMSAQPKEFELQLLPTTVQDRRCISLADIVT